MNNVIKYLSSFLQRIAESNDVFGVPLKTSIFHGLTRPSISILCYMERIYKYANCSPSCFVVAYIYIDRFVQKQPLLPISSFTVHRLLIASVLVLLSSWTTREFSSSSSSCLHYLPLSIFFEGTNRKGGLLWVFEYG
ncbi:UNVERIFIED_CONTAM: Cyclin-U4-1 [Sesamum latifolium]|uniref:Cyclin-U4-1 n=1 Tax=Sesamum latifolium TaxID=2727402 RepID=A0AAW2XF81_9LAMI